MSAPSPNIVKRGNMHIVVGFICLLLGLTLIIRLFRSIFIPSISAHGNGEWYLVVLSVIAGVEIVIGVYFRKRLRQWLLLNTRPHRANQWSIIFFILSTAAVIACYAINIYDIRTISLALFTLLFFGFIAQCLSIYRVNEDKTPKKQKTFIADVIPDNASDTLTRDQEKLSIRLQEAIESEGLTSVALTGAWGTGKSSIYIAARERIDEGKSCNRVWVEFYPWRYANEEALVLGFYEEIRQVVGKQFPGAVYSLNDMVRAAGRLVEKTGDTGKLIGSVIDIFGTANDGLHEHLGRVLEVNDIYLVIVMDDIERHYDPSRIYRALELVHYARRLGRSRVQTLLIYEESIIRKAAPAHVDRVEEYLEKFSELNLHVSPSQAVDLRSFIKQIVDKYTIFDVKQSEKTLLEALNESSIRALGTHRGIIRTFNHMISLERTFRHGGTKRRNRKDSLQYIYPLDRLLLSRLADCYPLVYDDVKQNRHVYTEILEIDEHIEYFVYDDERKKSARKNHIDGLLKRLFATEHSRVIDLLCHLFPNVVDIYEKKQLYRDDEAFRGHRVAKRIVLDGYFALSENYGAYVAAEQLVNRTLQKLKSARRETSRAEVFADFLQQSRKRGIHTHSYYIMQQRLRSAESNTKDVAMRRLRAWMLAELQWDFTERSDSNVTSLGRVLSAANEIVNHSGYTPEAKNRLIEEFFDGVEEYYSSAYAALLLLLYVLPERGNNFFRDYFVSSMSHDDGLFIRTLKWVDSHMGHTEDPGKKEDVFVQPYRYWAFVIYQWAFSVTASASKPNPHIPDSDERYKRVVAYMLKRMEDDPMLAYEIITKRFEDQAENSSFEDEKHRVSSETFQPLDAELVRKVIGDLLKSEELSVRQKKRLKMIRTGFSSNSSEASANVPTKT